MDRDAITNELAQDYGCSVADVDAALDAVLAGHPIEPDRNRFLARVLARELQRLDNLEAVFRGKAKAGDAAAGSLPMKIHELRTGLAGRAGGLGKPN